MNNFYFLKTLGNLAAAVLLFFTVTILLIILIWAYKPHWVDQIDKKIITRYTQKYDNRLHQAELMINKGNLTGGINHLELLLKDFKQIKKRDRLHPTKRKSYKILTSALVELKQYKRALTWFEQWISFDSKDIYAQARYALLLSNLPGHEKKGEKLLNTLFQKYPYDIVLDLYFEHQKHKGEVSKELAKGLAKAFTIYQASYMDLLMKFLKWDVYWDTGKGFNEQEKETVNCDTEKIYKDGNNNSIEIQFSLLLPSGVKRFRIDPPSVDRAVIVPSEVRLQNNFKEVRLQLSDFKLQLHQMKQPAKKVLLITEPFDPYFVLNLSVSDISSEPATMTFKASIFPKIFIYIDEFDMERAVSEELDALGAGGSTPMFHSTWSAWDSVIGS